MALETMDDEADDDDVEADQFFTLSSNTNPLEPFMNSIIHSGSADGILGRNSIDQLKVLPIQN